MKHRLALALGRTVHELEQTLSSSEFTDWCQYYELEPFGSWRDNWHMAQLCSLLYNINRGKQKSVSSEDFMYLDPEAARRKKDADILATLNSMSR